MRLRALTQAVSPWLTLLLYLWAGFVLSLVGAFLAGLWVGLVQRFFNLGLAWVTVYEQPVCRAWLTT